MKCVCPMGGDRTCLNGCPVSTLIEVLDSRAKRLISRRLSENLSDEKDLELWVRQQTWQHASIMVRTLFEGNPINEH